MRHRDAGVCMGAMWWYSLTVLDLAMPRALRITDDSCDDSHRNLFKLKVNIQCGTLIGVRSGARRQG